MHATRRLGPAVKAEVTADYNGLPHGRITEHDDAAHVFTASLAELEAWFTALGGHITQHPAGPAVVLWTLDTHTERTNGTPIRVHALALATDRLDAAITDAIL